MDYYVLVYRPLYFMFSKNYCSVYYLQVFQMKVNYGFKVSDEVVKTNVKEGTTEVDTKDEKGKM